MDKFIFFTHSLELTGSEVAIFNLIKNLKDADITVVLKQRGQLVQLLTSDVKVHDFESYRRREQRQNILLRFINRIAGRGRINFHTFLSSVLGNDPSTIYYVNTIYLPDVVSFLVEKNYRFVVHAHELQQMLVNLETKDVDNIVKHSDLVITSSETCKRVFATLGRRSNIEVCYPGVELTKIKAVMNPFQLRKNLNITADAFVVVMGGTIDINKNPEGFLSVAKQLRDKGRNVHFMWLGIAYESGYVRFLRNKTDELGLTSCCSWLGRMEGQSYYDHLNLADCLVLTSFKESFSIVTVEALALGKPVISFTSGGPEEILNSAQIGTLINDYSVNGIVDAILALLDRTSRYDAHAAQLRARDFEEKKSFSRWYSVMRSRYTLS